MSRVACECCFVQFPQLFNQYGKKKLRLNLSCFDTKCIQWPHLSNSAATENECIYTPFCTSLVKTVKSVSCLILLHLHLKRNLKRQQTMPCGVSLLSSWLGVVYSSSCDGVPFPSTLLIREIYSSRRWKVYDHSPHYQISILESVWCFWTCSVCRRLSEMDQAAIWFLCGWTAGEDMRSGVDQNRHDWRTLLYRIFKTGSTCMYVQWVGVVMYCITGMNLVSILCIYYLISVAYTFVVMESWFMILRRQQWHNPTCCQCMGSLCNEWQSVTVGWEMLSLFWQKSWSWDLKYFSACRLWD